MMSMTRKTQAITVPLQGLSPTLIIGSVPIMALTSICRAYWLSMPAPADLISLQCS